ncbi:hypothetical protein Aduo_019959 [Ancylostoma duodenale]
MTKLWELKNMNINVNFSKTSCQIGRDTPAFNTVDNPVPICRPQKNGKLGWSVSVAEPWNVRSVTAFVKGLHEPQFNSVSNEVTHKDDPDS